MGRQLKYYFNYIEECNMCGSPTSGHKILGRRLNTSQGKNPGKKIGITTTICKCNRCHLIYSNPQPVPFDLQDHYGVPPEAYWKNASFTVPSYYFEGEIRTLKTLIDFRPGMKSLDIGAGLGKEMIVLTEAGFDAYGFEPSKPFYEKAISTMGVNPEKLKLGRLEEMDYAENTFDFISYGAVLEHLYDPSAAILKTMRWLKPDGIIHIEVPSSAWLVNKIINLYYKLRLTDFVGNISPMHTPFHLYEFGVESFRIHAKKHNYEIAKLEYWVGGSYMPKLIDYFITPFMVKTKTGMQLIIWLRK
jgi:ubiquinone/menaquinone biosynthesis C-methylase UbiE